LKELTMTSKTMQVTAVAMAMAGLMLLGGCKRKEAAPATAPAQATTAAPAPAPAAQETPAASAATGTSPAAPAGKPFDLQSVPVSTARIPPFPFVQLPVGDSYLKEEKTFDRVYVLTGDQLKPVEGHFLFTLPPTDKMSALEAFRNYDHAIRELGAVAVSKISPADEAFIERNGGDKSALFKRMRIINLADNLPEDVPAFTQYLLRTPDRNIWFGLNIYDNESVNLIVLEEKAMEQKVKVISANDMATRIGKEGHVALHMNFDTDSDAIRPDSQPIVQEIAKLLRTDAQLKLKVEGHTDNSGDAAHNRTLSSKRALSVVHAVAAQGIDAGRMQAVGLGADRPVADNGTEEGRARNRRVELVKV
jgi:OmpA-OmpF porin, OOP family